VVSYDAERSTGLDADPDTGELNVTAIQLARTIAMDSFVCRAECLRARPRDAPDEDLVARNR